MSKIPSSYIFYQVFCEDSHVFMQDRSPTAIIFDPYVSKKLDLPIELPVIIAIGYKLTSKDEDLLFTRLSSPSNTLMATIPVGKLILEDEEKLPENQVSYGEMSVSSEDRVLFTEAGEYCLEAFLGEQSLSKTYFVIVDSKGNKND